ncbi:MAG: phage minor head protein, partial [Treponema pedis]
MNKKEWSDLERKLQFRAFTVARLTEEDYIQAVKNKLVAALENGEGIAETWEDVKAIAEKNGAGFSPGYWETVYRTNTQSAYNAGRLMQYQNNPPPAWELLFIEDGRQSDICKGIAALVGNGKALSANHNFWSTYGFPPYHFNCRTTFRAVYDYEIGHGTEIVNTPMKQIRKNFKPQKGFGGNPIDNGNWWMLTEGQIERGIQYGIIGEFNREENVIADYDS